MIYILLSTIIVPVLIGTFRFSLLPKYARLMMYYFYLCLITEIVSFAFAKMYGNNMVVHHFYIAIAAIILSQAYEELLDSVFPRILLIVPVIVAVEVALYGTSTFNSLSSTIFNSCMILTCLYAFYRMMIGSLSLPLVLINGVFMFYSLSSGFFFFTAKALQENDIDQMMVLFGIHAYINAITNIAYGICLWMLIKSFSSQRS